MEIGKEKLINKWTEAGTKRIHDFLAKYSLALAALFVYISPRVSDIEKVSPKSLRKILTYL